MKELYFSVEKFTYTKFSDDINIEFIPKLLKRRLNKMDKLTMYLLNNVYDETIENIVFSSRYGEFERLSDLIEQYKDLNEISPNMFSSSVHNFSVGFFSIFKKITVPTNALSASCDSFSLGLLNALLNKQNNIAYCYVDEGYGICFKINKNKKEYIAKKEENNTDFNKQDYYRFVDFIEKKEDKIDFPFYKIERLKND